MLRLYPTTSGFRRNQCGKCGISILLGGWDSILVYFENFGNFEWASIHILVSIEPVLWSLFRKLPIKMIPYCLLHAFFTCSCTTSFFDTAGQREWFISDTCCALHEALCSLLRRSWYASDFRCITRAVFLNTFTSCGTDDSLVATEPCQNRRADTQFKFD